MKTRKTLTKLAALALCIFSLVPAKAQKHKRNKNPNVVVIYTDDQRFTDVHIFGNPQVQTPNIDGLAKNGISFTHTYLMGAFSGATCIPSRSMLMTGRNLFQLRGIGKQIPKDHTTMGEAMKQAGYYSYIVGKWDQDVPSLERSFDAGSSIMGIGLYLDDHYRMPFWDYKKDDDLKKENAYLLKYDEKGKTVRVPFDKSLKLGPTGTEFTAPHDNEIYADAAVKFVKDYHKKKPFFMYLAFHAPHDPRQAPKKYLDMYPPNSITLPPSYLPAHPFDNGHMVLRDEELVAWPRTPEIVKKELAEYYAITTYMDAQIGRIIDALKSHGQYDNTIIVFAGDSGLAVGNHGLMGKQSVYDEDGIHIPFIISGDPIKDKGRSIDAFTYIHDIFPTVCDLAQIPIPSSVTGKSLAPVIDHKETGVRDYTYHAYLQFQRAYRKGNYKLIEYVKAKGLNQETKSEETRGSRVTQLFNIKKDPWESTNMAFLPENQQRLKDMQKEMQQTAKKLGDNKDHTGYPYNFWDFY